MVPLITLRPGGANTTHRGRDRPTRNTANHSNTIAMNLNNLISALMIVESSNNNLAIGDQGRAIGCLQIHRSVVLDVNRITGSHYRHQDMTNRAAARAVCQAYLTHYGRGATTEQLARRWNGGPTGDRKTATVTYWRRVQKHIK